MQMLPPGPWRREDAFPYQRVDHHVVVVDPGRRLVHVLNESAALIWDLLATPRSAQELVAALDDAYEVAHDELVEAVSTSLSVLLDSGLVVASAVGPP
jgi:hypothetical protein